jgi:hypothetical protein
MIKTTSLSSTKIIDHALYKENSHWRYSIALLIAFIILFGTSALMRDQDINWDLLGYHFYNGFAFVNHRANQDIMSALTQTYLNPFFDVITYLFIQLHNTTITKFLLGAVDGLNAFLIFLVAKKVFSNDKQLQNSAYALLAVLLGMTGAGSLSLLGSTTNDTYSTVMVLASFYFYLQSLDETPGRFYLSLSGLLIGAVFGLKLTNLSYLLALNVTLLFFMAKRTDFIIYGCCCFIGFFLVDGVWVYQVYKEFGNPIFPYYNNIFHSVYVPDTTFNMPPAFVQLSWQVFVFLPFYLAADMNIYSSEMVLRDGHFAVVALLFIVAGLLRSSYSQNRYLRALVIFFITSYILWCLEFHVYRYALSLEMLSGIVIIALLKPLLKTYQVFLCALAMLTFYLILAAHLPQWGRQHQSQGDYFSLQAPSVPDDAVIVLLSRPFTYVIPFFNPTAHFIGITFSGLGFASQEINDSLLYKNTIKVLRDAGRKNKLYGLSYVTDDLVTPLSYALLLNRKIGPTPDCQDFNTNIGDHLRLCKLMLFN